MAYRATVTLSTASHGLHMRPCILVAEAVHGLDVTLTFSRDGRTYAPRPDVMDIACAAMTLNLAGGTTFELTCDGPDAHEGFRRLRSVFADEEFAESTFEAHDPLAQDALDG